MSADDNDVSEHDALLTTALDDVGGFWRVAGVGGHVREAHGSVHGGSGRHRRQSGLLRQPHEERQPPG